MSLSNRTYPTEAVRDEAADYADEPNGLVARHFSSYAAGYADRYSQENSPSGLFFRRRQALVMEMLNALGGDAVLDVGCGPGLYAPACVAGGVKYHGIDASSGMIDEGRKRFGNLEGADFVVGDARRLPFASDRFDGALCLGVLEYVPSRDEDACLREMIRVVKPGGLIIFSFLNGASLYWFWCKHGLPVAKFILRNLVALFKGSELVRLRDCAYSKRILRCFDLRERLAVLRSFDLSIVEAAYFALNIFPPPFANWLKEQSVGLSSRLEPLLRSPLLCWMGMAFVVCVRTSKMPNTALT